MNKPLTDLLIKNRRPSDRRQEIPDGKIAGLYFVLQPTGARSWAVRYRFDRKPKKLTIGAYPSIDLATARKRALEALGAIAKGVDPAAQKQAAKAEKRASLDLVENVVDEFIARYAKPKTRDWCETQRLLNKDVVSAWRGRRLSMIGRADVHALLDGIIDRGAPVGANRTFAQLRKMCRWAVERGLIERNPCEGVSAPSAEKARDRVLSSEELQLVWRAAERLGYPFGPLVHLLILTGQRREEVGGARWSEIDLKKRAWTIPASRSKNCHEHSVPLSARAIDILSSLPRFEQSEFVFSPGKTPPSGYSRSKARLDAEIARLNDGKPIPSWTLHDLRRSVASGMASIGVDLHIIERCLNHVSGSFGGIVGVYQRHKFEDEMRSALDRWASHVERIVNGAGDGNVVAIKAWG